MPPQNQSTETTNEQTLGSYTVRLGPAILDAPIWYVQQPNPLGDAAPPIVLAMVTTSRRARHVAAALAVFDLLDKLQFFLGAHQSFTFKPSELADVLDSLSEARAFERKV